MGTPVSRCGARGVRRGIEPGGGTARRDQCACGHVLGLCHCRSVDRAGGAAERGQVQPNPGERGDRPRNAGDRGRRRRRGSYHWRPRHGPRYGARRHPAGRDESGTRVPWRHRLLGAGDSGRDHPGRRRDRCRANPACRATSGAGCSWRWSGIGMAASWRRASAAESSLALVLTAEIAIFSAIAPRFATVENAAEILRFSVELGLLAVALTPILVSGGIDLSVGSMMGLAAVVLGAASRDWGVPMPIAIGLALATGAAGGALNAALITRLTLPPLIVTLGTFSLFRGIAEAVTKGAVNYSGFDAGFLAIGQGYVWQLIPAQLAVLVAVIGAYAVLLHRSTIGRAIYAIGFSAAGARYAGIPVARRIGLVYVLAGLVASLAAIIYVARLGQAKSDAGTGYELDA